MLTEKFIPEYLHVLLILLKRHYILLGVLQHLWNTGLLGHPVAVKGLFRSTLLPNSHSTPPTSLHSTTYSPFYLGIL